jgi:ankyrin repeat protein
MSGASRFSSGAEEDARLKLEAAFGALYLGQPMPLEDIDIQARLFEAAKTGDIGAIRACLSEGADPNAKDRRGLTPLERAVMAGQGLAAAYLLDRGADPAVDGDWALCWAAEHGREEMVRLLLERGADVHATWEGPLRNATANGHIGIIRTLLAAGAAPDRLDSGVRQRLEALLRS